jgi:hypothetical protein
MSSPEERELCGVEHKVGPLISSRDQFNSAREPAGLVIYQTFDRWFLEVHMYTASIFGLRVMMTKLTH